MRTPTLRLLGRIGNALLVKAGYLQETYNLTVPPAKPQAGDLVRIGSDREQMEWVAQSALTVGQHGHLVSEIYGLQTAIDDLYSQLGTKPGYTQLNALQSQLNALSTQVNAMATSQSYYTRRFISSYSFFMTNNNSWRTFPLSASNRSDTLQDGKFKCPVDGIYRIRFGAYINGDQAGKSVQIGIPGCFEGLEWPILTAPIGDMQIGYAWEGYFPKDFIIDVMAKGYNANIGLAWVDHSIYLIRAV